MLEVQIHQFTFFVYWSGFMGLLNCEYECRNGNIDKQKMRCHKNTTSHLIKQYEKNSLNIAFHIHMYIGVFLPYDL